MVETAKENWGSGSAYDMWIGRWSRKVAQEFIAWLEVPAGGMWCDVGSGTGALTDRILACSDPAGVRGVDRSEAYVSQARSSVRDARVRFDVGDACALTWADATFDAAVSGLVLNFVAEADAMAREMVRVTKPGGKVAVYVWDYAGGMQMLRHFWDVAVQLNRGDSRLDQAERFPICQPGPLEQLFRRVGLDSVAVRAIEIPTVFRDFDDYWGPFLGKQGPAPTYLASLPEQAREQIREALRARLDAAADGSIAMAARAWAVQGTVPAHQAPDRAS